MALSCTRLSNDSWLCTQGSFLGGPYRGDPMWVLGIKPGWAECKAGALLQEPLGWMEPLDAQHPLWIQECFSGSFVASLEGLHCAFYYPSTHSFRVSL